MTLEIQTWVESPKAVLLLHGGPSHELMLQCQAKSHAASF